MSGFADGTPPSSAKMQTPAMFVAPAHDVQALPKNVGDLMADYGAKEKSCLTWRALVTTLCGSETTCCSFRHRWSGCPKAL